LALKSTILSQTSLILYVYDTPVSSQDAEQRQSEATAGSRWDRTVLCATKTPSTLGWAGCCGR
jgi:hypothetical protein